MRERVIKKDLSNLTVQPFLVDLQKSKQVFSWSDIRKELSGLPGGGLNIAYEAIDRHVRDGHGARVAFHWNGKKNERKTFTYEDMRLLTNRFASVLRNRGLEKGDTVFALLGRIPLLYVTVLGAMKDGCVVSPLFSAFGPEPIQNRVTQAAGKVLVTTDTFYRKKVAGIREMLPSLRLVFIVREQASVPLPPETLDFWEEMAGASDEVEIEFTAPEDPALLHFTSGTTGTPKGALHVHEAAVMHYMTGKYALDLHDTDIFWCTADPGWVTGTSYGIIAPLLHGVTSIIDEAEFDPSRWYQILQDEKVTVWYTAPTAIRMLMKAGSDLPRQYDLHHLRFIASVGEPLNPEAVWWGEDALGKPIHDNWWQSETGGIMIANFASMDIRPGSMGKPLPGVEAFIVRKRPNDGLEFITEPNVQGELALRVGWPSMFRAYLHQDERYRKSFVGDIYLSGDLAKRDEDGYFWFVGRADDVIKCAGHLIGPFEIESALMEHPAVAEAGVIGKPDPVSGETVKAFVSLKKGFAADEGTRMELLGFARKRLGAAIAPKEVDIVPSLPKTRSGKIMRRLLKAREMGLPEGDLSTLESGA